MLGKTKNPGGQSAPQKNKYLVIALLCLPFVLCLYLIFGGSGEQAPATGGGVNFNIPDGRTQNIEGNKQKAMEREQMNEQHDARVRTLAESTFSLSGDTVQAPKREQAQPDQIAQSRNTYRDLTREMNSFYATPRPDPQIAALKKQVAELSAELEQSRKKPDPLDYMERSYALASKYLGGATATGDDLREVERPRGMSAPHGGRNSFGIVAACERFGVHGAIRQAPQLRIQHRRRRGCRGEPQRNPRGY